MNRVFLWISGSMTIGILSSYYFHFNRNLIFLLFVLMFLYTFYSILREKLNNIQIIIIFLFVGVFLEVFFSKSQLITYVDTINEYSGFIEDISLDSPNKKRYIVKIDSVNNRGISPEKISLNILSKDTLDIGWRLDFTGKLSLPNVNTNPNLFNYRQHLLSKGIYTSGTIKEYNIDTIDRTSSPMHSLKTGVINRIDALYDHYLSGRNSSILKSMLLGDSSYVGEEDLRNYRDLGLAHILAISGLHIGIISGFLLFIFSRIGIKRRLNILITLSFIWIYAFLVGFPPSILRANIMLSVLLYSQIFHEPYDILNTIFFAMAILLILNPYAIFSLGFILSFAATISIVVLTPRIKVLFYPNEGKLITTLSGILAVQIGLFPIMAYYFNSIPLLSIIGNLFIIPLLSFAIVLGFSMFFINFIFSSLNGILACFLNLILDFQFSLVDLFSGFYFKEIKLASPNIFTICLYYIFIFLLFKIIEIEHLNKRLVKTISIYILIFTIGSLIIIELDDRIELHFIDVGQGDSILIRNPDFDYLIDTGGSIFGDFDIGENITLPYLDKIGVKRLKAVFISHFHEDHYQGLYALLDNIRIDNVLATYIPKDNEILNEINKQAIPFLLVDSGDNVNLGNGLKMDIIWSNERIYENENNMSLVCILNYRDHRVLFTGDMEKEVEREILDHIPKNIDIIKVPHHGSNTSSTMELLDKINPQIGLISLGRNNMYGHPSNEVLDRYRDVNTRIYRTDESGMVKMVLRDGSITVEEFLQRKIDMEFYFLYYIIYLVLSYILVRLYDEMERRCKFELQ